MNVKFRFRSKSSGRVLNVSQVCSSSYEADFYNIVFSHGDGSLQNYPDRELCAKQNFKNDDPIAFCICRYIDLFIAFYIFSIRSGFNVRNISPRNSSMRQSHSLCGRLLQGQIRVSHLVFCLEYHIWYQVRTHQTLSLLHVKYSMIL